MLYTSMIHEGIFEILHAFEMHCMSLRLKFEKNCDNLQKEKNVICFALHSECA